MQKQTEDTTEEENTYISVPQEDTMTKGNINIPVPEEGTQPRVVPSPTTLPRVSIILSKTSKI